MALDLSALRKSADARSDRSPSKNWTGERPTRQRKTVADEQAAFPHSVEAEQGVLGSMLVDAKNAIPIARQYTYETHYYVPAHRTVFTALCDMWDSGTHVDLITFTQFLRDKRQLDAVGGPGFVTELFTFVPTASHIQYYLEIVREKFIQRELIAVGTNMVRAAHGEQESGVVQLAESFSRKIERIKQYAGGPNGAHELTTERLRELKSIPDKNALVGNRWLVRGGNVLWAAGAGYGKSSLTMQLAVYWACGQSIFGLRPHFPLKSLIIQAENDDHDMSEQYNGVIEGIESTGDLDIQGEQETIDKNLIVLRMEGVSGPTFLSKLHGLLELYRPALLWIDPLFSFAGCDLIDAEKTGHFLREGLFPLFTKFGCCGCVIHHVGKPPRAQATTFSPIDEQYLSFGSSEIQNAFRAVNVIKPPTQDAPGVFRLVFSKRGERAKAKDTDGNLTSTIFLKHSFPHICWQQVPEPEKPKKNGAALKYEVKDVLDQMSVTDGKPVGALQTFVSEQTGMSRAAFYRLWKDLKEDEKVRVDSHGNWFPKRLNLNRQSQ